MSTKANLCFRWGVVWGLSVVFVFAGSRDSQAVDPTKIRQQAQAQAKPERVAEQRPGDSDRSTDIEQQRLPRDRDRLQGDDASVNRDASPQFRPPRRHPRHWMLGVRVQYLETGAQITRVFRNTPAQRYGLEPRDIIVAIDGYQIGYVNGRLYDLQTELNVRARGSGWVRLLLQNRRNDRLLNVDVRLARFGDDAPRERGIDVRSESEIDQADEVGRDRLEVKPNQAVPIPKSDGDP